MDKKTTSINQDTTQTPSFEASMQELEHIVNRLESGELPLEEALNEFEHGV
ncbi:exodeoxyribonuclease VII small subunit, partial [Proteus mirabilis]|uniref:exodeoxyribonuclease VII small subunit n=1 Tax=Proteus mirabilis TaxID=584 RepID=UPI0025753852